MTDPGFRCDDRIPSPPLRAQAAAVAVATNAANLPETDGFEGAGDPTRYWAPGTGLRVRYLDGPAALRDHVTAAASAWTAHANLDLVVVADGPAEIRVTFVGEGNWSALGTDALLTALFAPDGPTMCLSEVPQAPPRRVDRLARHEFGHAIGLVHEHSSPASTMHWNRAVVLAELAGPPNHWSAAEVEFNVFQRYGRTTTQYTAFDPESVMLYSFPARWVSDGASHPENSELSALDRAFVRSVYPGR